MKAFMLLSVILIAGCVPGGGNDWCPQSGSVVSEVFEEYRAGVKQVLREAAEKLESGEHETEVESNQFIHDRTLEVRIEAFMKLNRDASQEIGGTRWSPTRAGKYWRRQAESL